MMAKVPRAKDIAEQADKMFNGRLRQLEKQVNEQRQQILELSARLDSLTNPPALPEEIPEDTE